MGGIKYLTHQEHAALLAENERLRAALKDCADDLESEVKHRYDRIGDHPAMAPKYERDMEPVKAARALLADEQQKDGKLAGPIEFAPEALAADASIKQDGGTVD
jgi:hypothetical protein